MLLFLHCKRRMFHQRAKLKLKVTKFWNLYVKIKKDGGTAIGAYVASNPFLIKEYCDEFELLVVEVQI